MIPSGSIIDSDIHHQLDLELARRHIAIADTDAEIAATAELLQGGHSTPELRGLLLRMLEYTGICHVRPILNAEACVEGYVLTLAPDVSVAERDLILAGLAALTRC